MEIKKETAYGIGHKIEKSGFMSVGQNAQKTQSRPSSGPSLCYCSKTLLSTASTHHAVTVASGAEVYQVEMSALDADRTAVFLDLALDRTSPQAECDDIPFSERRLTWSVLDPQKRLNLRGQNRDKSHIRIGFADFSRASEGHAN